MNHNSMLYAVIILAVVVVAAIALGGYGPTGQVTGFCRDTDGGINVNVAGNVKVPDSREQGRGSGIVHDSCVGGMTGRSVREMYCDGLKRKSTDIDCVSKGYTRCERGKCV